MSDHSTGTTRYSEADLTEFKEKIEQKLADAEQQIELFEGRIQNISESKEHDGDWVDDTANNQDLEMSISMVNRQKKYAQDLKNALIRIQNKSYGICIITGELIDKRRLLAVPTTTKSLAAKTAPPQKTVFRKEEKENKKQKPTERTIISKVIKRTGGKMPTPPPAPVDDDFFEDDDDLDMDIDMVDEIPVDSDLEIDEDFEISDEEIDFDNIAAE